MRWSSRESYAGKNVVVTGGSTGIGLALAKELCKKGANIVLIARNRSKIDKAIASLELIVQEIKSETSVRGYAADVCDSKQVQEAIKHAGQVDVLICCAGRSIPGRFLEQELDVFESTMQLNYFGSLRVVKAALPDMVKRRSGKIVLVSSAAAVCGVAGYSSYAPSKAALRSLADTLRNELLPTGVRVMIAYPPDTDTPGYENENLTKPPECHAISRAAGDVLFTPEQVAKSIIGGMERGAYHLPGPDFGQNMMVAASAGLSPHMFNVLLEFLLAPIMVIVLRIFGSVVDKAVMKHAVDEKNK